MSNKRNFTVISSILTISKSLKIYLGAVILDVSKLQPYKLVHVRRKARIMYKDTDSLFYEIETKDVYEDFESLKEDLDFSPIRKIISFSVK